MSSVPTPVGESRVSRVRAATRRALAAAKENRIDLAIVLAFMIAGAAASYVGSGLMDSAVASRETFDMWFDADAPRVYDNLVSRFSNYKRSDVHPLFGLIGFPPVFLLRRFFGLDGWVAVRVVVAAVAAVWSGTLFLIFRRIGLRGADASLFTLLGMASAGSVFWFVVPETISFGSVTLLFALLLAAEAGRGAIHPAWTTAVGVATLGVTVSNWAAGLLASVAIHSKKDAARVIVTTVFVVSVLTSVSVYMFPNATLLGLSQRARAEEPTFLVHPESGGPLTSARAFLFHSIVLPEIQVKNPDWDWLKWKNLRVQHSRPGSGSPVGVAAILVWSALLLMGAWAFRHVNGLNAFRIVLVGTLLSQLALHTLFGRETFLYSLHFAPLLIVVAALGALTKYRRVTFALGVLLLPLAVFNNASQFSRAMDVVQDARPRAPTLADTVELSPKDGVLGATDVMRFSLAGGAAEEASYLGPGGSISPFERSFGIAMWVLNGRDLVLTSDTFMALQQTSRPQYGRAAYVVESDNYYAKMSLTLRADATRTVQIRQTDNMITRLALAVRSGGPSGGPISAIEWNGERLLVNNRWQMILRPKPIAVRVGEEEAPGRLIAQSHEWRSEHGRGYAILELAEDVRSWTVEITDLRAAGTPRERLK